MKLGPYELDTIYTGDARELAKAIPDESVDLIFTDPPYPEEYLSLYECVSEIGARVLKPGGLCLALVGDFQTIKAAVLMEKHLDYYWIGGMGHDNGNAPIFPRQMWAAWKPMLWFVKSGQVEKQWTFDFFTPSKADKRFHGWGQPADHAIYYIDRLSRSGSIIVDPFAGGGTVSAVCKMLGRHYLGFEIDPDTAERARQRVLDTQPPLFVPQLEQAELFNEFVTDGGIA